LEASPYDAERITTAARLGKLSLVVRSAAGEGDSEANAETLIKGACPATRQQPIGGAPIAWGGDVSPALRDHSGAKSGAVVRMYIGPKVAEEVKFLCMS
jgi:Flp pilus assembly protein CpaB